MPEANAKTSVEWTAMVTNKKVIERVGSITPREPLTFRPKWNYLGHFMRHEGMEKDVTVVMVEGSRRR